MIGTDQSVYAIRVTCLGDADVLPGEPVMIYHRKGKVWNATFLAIPDNTVPELYEDKEEAKLEAKVLQKQLDFLADQMRSTQMKIADAAFFVKVVRWDISDFYIHRDVRRELASVSKKRRRKKEKKAYLESIQGPTETKSTFKKASKDMAIID